MTDELEKLQRKGTRPTCPHCHATVLSTSQPNLMGTTPEMQKMYDEFGGEPVAWRWRTLQKFSEDAADQEWELTPTAPNFINPHHHEVQPLYAALAATPAVGGEGMVLHPLSEIREWDEALAVLGIQDSDQTPADAIRELNHEIERLRSRTTALDPADAVYYEGYEQARSDLAPPAAPPASPLQGITDEMLNAHLKATAEWVDPYEAATECGVPIECGITQDDADELNAQSRASLRVGYTAAFASLPEHPADDQ